MIYAYLYFLELLGQVGITIGVARVSINFTNTLETMADKFYIGLVQRAAFMFANDGLDHIQV